MNHKFIQQFLESFHILSYLAVHNKGSYLCSTDYFIFHLKVVTNCATVRLEHLISQKHSC